MNPKCEINPGCWSFHAKEKECKYINYFYILIPCWSFILDILKSVIYYSQFFLFLFTYCATNIKIMCWLTYISIRLRRMRKIRKKTKLPVRYPERTTINIFRYFPFVSVKMSVFLSVYSLFQYVKQCLQGQRKVTPDELKTFAWDVDVLMWKSWIQTHVFVTPNPFTSKACVLSMILQCLSWKNLYQKNQKTTHSSTLKKALNMVGGTSMRPEDVHFYEEFYLEKKKIGGFLNSCRCL